MSSRFTSKAYTLTATPTNLRTAITGGNNPVYVASVVMRAKWDNVGKVFWTDLAGEIGGYLEPREAATIDLSNSIWLNLDNMLIYGTAGDVVYFTLLG